MKGSPYLKYLPYAFKAAQPYMKTHRQRNPLSYRKKKTKAKGYARTSRRKYKRTTSKVARNAKSIKKLQAHDRQSLGDMTYRDLNAVSLTSLVNQQNVYNVYPNATATLETVLGQCKFYNPSVPGTLTTASLATGTYQRNTRFENIHNKCNIRNNYQSTCEVRVYLCTTKDDTSVTPAGAWQNGLPDGSNLSTLQDLGGYPTDYELATDLWKMKLAKRCVLAPGQSTTVSHSTGSFEYSSSTVDDHALSYQKEYKCFSWMIVINGVVGHDTALSEFANLPAGRIVTGKQ
jgi:hypothetical protein